MKKTLFGIFWLIVFISGFSVFGQSASFQRFDSQAAFIGANSNPTIISYDNIANGRLPTYEYAFLSEGVKIKPNDPGYSQPVYIKDFSSVLPGKEFIITGNESMEFTFTTPVNAFGYDFIELTACVDPWCPTAIIDSTFVISIYNGTTKLTEYTFNPTDSVATFFGVSSNQLFDRVVVQETVGGVDDELYGKLYIKRPPFTCPADFIKKTPELPAKNLNIKTVPSPSKWSSSTHTPANALPDAPRARYGHDMVAINSKIYVLGGSQTGSNVVDVFDTTTDTWNSTEVSPYPVGTSVAGIMAVALDNNIFTIHGKTLYKYSVIQNSWTKKADMPAAKYFGSAEVVDGKIYVLGGGTNTTATTTALTLYIYNPLTDTWSSGENLPKFFRFTESAVSGGKIYIAGDGATSLYVYDTCTDSWSSLGNMPGGTWTHNGAATVNGEIYFSGGTPAAATSAAISNQFRKYNPATGQWTTTLDPLPFSTYHVRSVTVDGKIYVMGGATSKTASGYAPTAKISVYNAGTTTVDETISACYCQPACGEGKYYSAVDNVCLPSHYLVGQNICNKNSVCEAGESCNCSDCTNGGADDFDACGVSNGIQMYCSRDEQFSFPAPVSSVKKFENNSDVFLRETKSAIFDYSYKVPADKRFSGATGVNSQVATVPFGLPSNITLISRGGPGGDTYGNDYVWFSYGKLPGNSIFNTMASMSYNTEAFDLKFPNPINAFGIEIYEMHNPPAGFMGCNTTCTESTFSFRLLKDGAEVSPANNLTFAPENNRDQFFGFSTPFEFDEVQIREKTGSHDNERFGRIYYQDRSAGAEQCETKRVLMTSTANYPDNKYFIFYDYTPQEVTYNGKTMYIYNPIGNTTASLSSIIANPSLEFSKIKKFTTPFQFRPERLTPTNSTTIFTNAGVTRVNSNLLCFFQANGVEKCQYDNAAVGYPVFAQVPSTGQPSDVIYATSRDDAGFVTYARADEVRAFDVQVCQPVGADICGIGACCPSGKTWDCDTNSCIEKVEENVCVAGPTLKYGRDITDVKNASNQAFALNASCENKQISLSPCSLTPGVIPQGTSPAGYKLYLWPKSASGLSKDYNLVEIQNQCWFADNLQESPSQWPSPVNIWENYSPHNGYGLYDYNYIGGGAGVYRPDGYLYQFDAGTNNTAHGGAPAERLQGVCPAGWHVATDCEFQYVEHALGMSVSDQQNIGTRSSGNVGTRMKADGTSGLDMTLSGTRLWNTDFINGTGEGHFWTSECTSGGCYKRIIDSTGSVRRIVGGAAPYDSAHHAAGSIRCVKDGSEVVNSCSEAVCPQGKYWCHAESTCKDAGQSCSTVTCNNNGTCDVNESCNCNDCTAEADHCGQTDGKQLYCSRDKDTTPPIPPAPTGDNCRTVEGTNTYTFDVNGRSNDTSKQQTIATLEPGEYEITGSGQFIKCTTSNCGWSTGQVYVTSTGPSLYNLREQSNTTRNWTVNKNFLLNVSEKLIVTGVQAQMRGSLTVKSRKRVCDNIIQCLGEYKSTAVQYIPNVSPSTLGWTGVCSATINVDNGKPICQIRDTSDDNGATISKKLSEQETTKLFTSGGKLSAEIKIVDSATKNAPTNGAHLMASYMELSVGQTTGANGTIIPRKRFTLTLGMDVNRTPTVYAFTTNNYSGTTPYKYTVTGGADAYNLYEMVYDPMSASVDVYVNGVERISNYPGNTVSSDNLQAANQARVYFGSGSSPGIATTNYGKVQLLLKDDACRTSIVGQIGACCPADTEWSSVANACVSDSCGEGQYYCHEELKCKPANEPCYALVCDQKKVFAYTGSVQDYTVPSDVKKIEIKAWGAGGGGTTHTSALGGVGAYAFTSLPVNAGETYKVVVGQGGQGSATVGTFGGGGAGGLAGVSGGSGGGLSGIFKTAFTQPNALLVAAGGGGASGSCSADCPGGNGGGPNGVDGMSVGRADNFFYPGSGGKGGTLTIGGLGGVVPETARNGSNGSALQGGIGGSHNAPSYGGGGGGGGGYFGGGGGSGDATAVAYSTNYTNDASGGGGSSSCPTVNASGDCVVVAGTGSTVPRNTDADYKTGSGIAGMYTVAGGHGHVVIFECRPKPSVTCNNNGVCDENESCNCADCNEQVDHCGVNGSGEQLICTKDTAERCYTDKFPYCLSACLDGYTRNASGQCEPTTAPTTSTPPSTTFTCENRAQSTFDMIEARLAPYMSQPGNLNIAAGEFGTAQTELGMTQDTRQDNAPSFTKEESWARVKELLSIPDSAQIVWTKSSNLYSNTAYGGSHRYVHSYVIQISGSAPRQITYATEYLPGYGWRKVYFTKEYPLLNPDGQCMSDVIMFAPPSCINRSVDGTTTAIATCQTNEILTGGGCSNTSGGAYFLGGFPINQGESWTTYTPTYDPGYWHSYELPTSPVGPLTASGNGFACATGYSATYVRATAVCCQSTSVSDTLIRKGTIADTKSIAQCTTGEVRVGGGCRYISGGSYFKAGYPINKGETYDGLTATEDGFVCVGGVGTQVEARAVCKVSKTGETVKVVKGPVNGVATCDDGYVVTGGGCESIGGAYYYIGNIIRAGQTDTYTNLTPTNDGYVCASGASGTNSQPYAICVSPSEQTNTPATTSGEQWIAYTTPYYIYLAKLPITANTVAGKTFYIYNPEKVIARASMTKEAFLANPTQAIQNAPNIPVGNTSLTSRRIFNLAQLQSENNTLQNTTIDNLDTVIENRYLCTQNQVGATSCHTNNDGIHAPGTGYTIGGDIYAPITDSDSNIGYTKAEVLGTFVLNNSASCQNFTGNVEVSGGYLHVGKASTDQFCKEKGFNSSTLISQYTQSGSCRLWNGTSWYEDPACQAVSEVKCCNVATTPTANQCTTPKMKINFTRTENAPNAITLGANTVLTNNPSFDLVSNSTAITDATLLYETPNLAVRRHNGYVEFLARNALSQYGYYTGTVTLENATVNRVEGGLTTYGYTDIGLESAESDSVTKTSDTVVNFQIAFAFQGDSFRIYYTPNAGSGTCSTPPAVVTPPSSSTDIQLGACCPPGSAWNSIANACIPSTCGEGKFYCAAQKKCLAGGQTCDTAVCNNDGVCSGDESCQCGDCTNGGPDDKDKCSIIGGIQALCSDDDRGDNKPGACCIPPKRWDSKANGGGGACVECTNTQAPSELQENFDQPYITCHGNGDNAKTHYRYKLTKVGSSDAPYISPITPIKQPVLHTTMSKGEYSVECFYGTATTVDTGAAVSPDVCVKNISVKDSGTGAVQGCSRIYGYKGSTLSDEMNTDSDTLYASFRCGSRLPSTGVDRPYHLRVGTNLAELTYDGSMAAFFNELAIGPVSTQTNAYKFETGSTNVSCSVKVGSGYSTNKSCQLRTCVGGECARPNTFSVVHSANAICTTSREDEYNIGCNPDAPDTNRDACVKWFRDSFDINAGRDTFDIPFTINGRVRNISCKIIPAGSLPAALNVQDNYACSTRLPNGETVQLFNGDQSLQTTAYTVNFDDEKPRILAPKYFTDNTLTTAVEDVTKWQRLPVTAEVTCVDTPTTESTSCACARTLDAGSPAINVLWSQGTPDGTLGADIMRYTRTFTTTITGQAIRAKDTANNTSDPVVISPISIDTQAPVVGIQETGTGTTKTLNITLTDGISKIWNTTANPNDGTNVQGFIYKKVSKTQAETALFDPTCGVTGVYATVSQSASVSPTRTLSITGVNLANEVISYCVQDNAGNVTRGVYPAEPTGCFSASNMSTVPTLSTYKTPLQANITANKFGYSLSEDAANATCFRGILSSNITTLITNQYNPSTSTILNWSTPATLKNTSTANTNGYYYHRFTTANNANHTNNTVTLPNTSPTGTGQRVVLVDGGNIQINQNIDYSGSDKTLVLIARRTNNSGGNIFIHPNVTRIDAILIADGSVMNAETTATTTTSSTTIRNWIDHANILTNRLTINGRIYSFNTRGGSLDTSLAPLTANGRYYDLGQLKSDATPAMSAAMDLERFRIISHDGSATCSLAINYRVLTTFSLPLVLQRPAGYVGGTCNF